MNSMPVELLPIARDDVNNALVYIAAEDPGAADRLLDELLAAMDQLSRFPLSAPEVSVGGRHPRRYYRVPVPTYKEIPHKRAACLAVPFPPCTSCKFLDLPPASLRNLQARLTENSLASQPPLLCGISITFIIGSSGIGSWSCAYCTNGWMRRDTCKHSDRDGFAQTVPVAFFVFHPSISISRSNLRISMKVLPGLKRTTSPSSSR